MANKRTSRTPVVSIICITYNQEKFIGQAIESFLAQKTKFPIEVLVHDDASTDSTAKIIADYAERYLDIIKPLYEKENQFSSGNDRFINEMFNQARGKYIAICEGDDFWTDPEKLQRQVDFLESHPDYSMCFHPVRVFYEDGHQEDSVYPESHQASEFTVTNLLRQNFIQSNSIMYRISQRIHLPSGVMPLDWYAHLYYAQFGKIGFINRVMSAYRRHEAGIWWDSQGDTNKFWAKNGVNHIIMYNELLKIYDTNPEYRKIIVQNIIDGVSGLLKLSSRDQIRTLSELAERAPSLVPIIVTEKDETIKNKDIQINKLNDVIKQKDQIIESIHASRAWKVRNKLVGIIGKKPI